MSLFSTLSLAIALACSPAAAQAQATSTISTDTLSDQLPANIYAFSTTTSSGQEFRFADLRGKVIVVVNTASKCGFTPEFKELEDIYKRFNDQGFCMVGFPSGDFADQELADGAKAAEFCQLNYGVTFPIMQKVHVNGNEADPLFVWLKARKGFQGLNPAHRAYEMMKAMFDRSKPGWEQSSDIKWNFTKFLIDKDGNVINRYETTSDNQRLAADIEAALAR